MDLGLTGKVALIAGSSYGIGNAIAKSLHLEGCKVALNARGKERLEQAGTELGKNVSTHQAEVIKSSECIRIVEEVIKRWGKLDILICNVGGGKSVKPGNETEQEWKRMFELNLWSATNMVEAAKSHLTESKGAIVCISSISGNAALGAPVTYSVAKAALNAYVLNIARPLAPIGIRINSIAPGNIYFKNGVWDKKLAEDKTSVHGMLQSQVAMNRMGTPEEVADLACYLASPRASFITGRTFVVDGGQLRN